MLPWKDRLYVVEELPGRAGAACLSREENGGLRALWHREVPGAGLCHITASGGRLYASGYAGGTLTGLDAASGEPCFYQEFHGHGPNVQRQERAHIHSAQPAPEGARLLVADLGTDRLYQFVQEEGGARSHGQGAPSFHLSGKRVLLAEDNEINMEVATELMSAAGLELTQAWNGREALDAFRASEPFWFDVVLMDMQIPEMDGCEAARRIRRLRRPDARTVPIIAVTANTCAEDIAATEEAGMDAHISKPIDFSDLCRTMERLIRERRQTQGGETG